MAGVVGANQASGALYVFVKPATGWTDAIETAELTAPNTYNLGWSVSIIGNTIVTGSPFMTVGFNQFQGAAFVYLKPTSDWKNTSKPNAELTASDGAANDMFGSVVGISGGTVLATAPQATINGNAFEGAAYVFGR